MNEPSVKVLYIIGKGRSGSTILDHALGQLDGFASTGELWHLWTWGIGQGGRCGCGKPVPECPIWSDVLADLEGAGVDPEQTGRDQDRILSWPRTPSVLSGRLDSSPAMQRYVGAMSQLYRSLATAQGADVVVDSSKWPAHPGVLGFIPNVDPYVLHLVRDPRAVAYSYRRRKTFLDQDDEPTPMPRFSGWHSGLSWAARNAVAEWVRAKVPPDRYRLQHYERLVRSPRDEFAALARFVGQEFDEKPFLDERTIRLSPTHTVAGNPSKFTSGETRFRPDDEWRDELPTSHRIPATLTSLPLLRRYGYPIRLSGGRES